MAIFLWMLVVALPLFLALPVVLWRYRLGGRGRHAPDWGESRGFELAIWGLPALVVAVLGWALWQQTLRFDPYRPLGPGPALEVEVVGYDWKWLFLYPGLGLATADALYLPAGRPVHFRLTSATVLQSFMIPRLGGQIYAMPGMATELYLRADAPGRLAGLNTQFSGAGFARQGFAVEVLEPGAFDAWASGLQQTAPPLDTAALAEIARQGTLPAPRSFGQIPPGLFGAILAEAMGPASAAMPEGAPQPRGTMDMPGPENARSATTGAGAPETPGAPARSEGAVTGAHPPEVPR